MPATAMLELYSSRLFELFNVDSAAVVSMSTGPAVSETGTGALGLVSTTGAGLGAGFDTCVIHMLYIKTIGYPVIIIKD